ncbi:hypothetical protein AB0N07_16200 [Streptomyces sp. NPDC051172]|uniref:hypothetical protein n=1 Tax=Streptomyces sp. NPDC051172 TaxID=3155796 RepID=UPI00342982BA
MDDTRIPPAEPGAALLRAGRFFRPGATAPDLRSVALTGGRATCRWAPAEDEPRGCPREAAFSCTATRRPGCVTGMARRRPRRGQDSGRRRLPLVPVENFHAPRGRRTTDETKEI